MPSTPTNDITPNTVCRLRLFLPPNLCAAKKLTTASKTNETPAVTNMETVGAMACARFVAIGALITCKLFQLSNMKTLLVIVCLLTPLTSFADTFTGRVVSISDGDTITVLVEREQIKVRLIEIDAPEKIQAFGNKSKQALADMVFGEDVQVEAHGKDKYKRTLGRVLVNGLDANAEMVRQGYAWVYRKYSKNPGLLQLETEAKAAKRGLWVDPEPIPPWEWRHSKK